MLYPIAPLVTADPGVLSRDELRRYLNVGANALPGVVRRFALEPVAGCFPWRSVWRQILGLEPADDEQEELLRQPLQKIVWVSQVVKRAPSTVRRRAREGRFDYPAPAVDLGESKVASRSKRWIPEQIIAARQGRPVPLFRAVEPIRAEVARCAAAASDPTGMATGLAPHNAFSEILRANAQPSRLRAK